MYFTNYQRNDLRKTEFICENYSGRFGGAAVKDISDLIDEVEEIRRGYGIDDSDADKALADMCGNYCENEGDGCYIEGEKYHCENFKWRGLHKEE